MKTYRATRGVSWKTESGWENREAGDDISDAPAEALKDFLEQEEPAAEEVEDAKSKRPRR